MSLSYLQQSPTLFTAINEYVLTPEGFPASHSNLILHVTTQMG